MARYRVVVLTHGTATDAYQLHEYLGRGKGLIVSKKEAAARPAPRAAATVLESKLAQLARLF